MKHQTGHEHEHKEQFSEQDEVFFARLLEPLSQVKAPEPLRMANRRRIAQGLEQRQHLESDARRPFWRRCLPVPLPVAVAFGTAFCVLLLMRLPEKQEQTASPVAPSPKIEATGWHFNQSPILIDDQTVAGRIDSSGREMATIEIPGVARINCALSSFDGALPIGTMRGGRLHIKAPDGTEVEIVDVKYGGRAPLPTNAPPRTVYVEWQSPNQPAPTVPTVMSGSMTGIK